MGSFPRMERKAALLIHIKQIAQAEECLSKASAGNAGSSEAFLKRLSDTWKSKLKNTGTYFAFLKRNGVAEKTLNVPAWRLAFPIPRRELDLNPALKQNPGY